MAAQEQSTKKESGNGNENGLISPIQFVAIVAPDKPPQFAYQLLKQGLPHVIVHTKDSKGNPKQKPMIDPAVARQWYDDFIATKTPRKNKGTGSNGGDDNGTDGHTPGKNALGGQNIAGQKTGAYRKGQLLTYQRNPGLCTVAQVRASDPAIVLYTTVHGDLTRTVDEKYSYPFLPETLRDKILSRKIILDHPRRVLQYVVDSLHTLPLQEDDQELASLLQEALKKHPYQAHAQQEQKSAEQQSLESDLEDMPASASSADEEDELTLQNQLEEAEETDE